MATADAGSGGPSARLMQSTNVRDGDHLSVRWMVKLVWERSVTLQREMGSGFVVIREGCGEVSPVRRLWSIPVSRLAYSW